MSVFRFYLEAHHRRLFVQVSKGLDFDLKRIHDLLPLKMRSATGGELAGSLMEHLDW